MAQWVESLLCTHGDLRSSHQNLVLVIPALGRQKEKEGSLGLNGSQAN